MNFLILAILGALSGWIASMIMKTNASQGILADVFFGVIGALLGGFIMSLFGQPGVTGLNLYSILVAVVGASIVIYASKLIRRA